MWCRRCLGMVVQLFVGVRLLVACCKVLVLLKELLCMMLSS